LSASSAPAATVPEGDRYTKLTQDLLEAFPSQGDIDILCKSDYDATFYFHQIITQADGLDHVAFDFVNELAKIPDPFTHPALVAKRMFIFASFLQGFPPRQVIGLVEQASVVMKRLADTAIRLVTTNEEIVGCMEGLECIILEGVFHVNAGNLRRAWLAFRKAMVTAQLMKMDRPNPPPAKSIHPKTRINPSFMWFRIVQMDRLLSLMLGLSQGSPNSDMDCDVTVKPPIFRLERAHVAIAGRIIERNRHDPLLQDVSTTQKIDTELLSASTILPDEFWALPNFATSHRYTADSFQKMARLAHQLHHYNLVHLLHLPYLLRCDEESYHIYAKTTCVNASRELLTRCIAFRNFNTLTTACRTADFLALMAGLTILLAHMDSRRQDTQNMLAHQRLGDRAMVKQVHDSMEELGKHTGDTLMSKSARLLRCLLQIESEVVQGEMHTSQSALSYLEQECSVLQLPIPYFGIIQIAGKGIISRGWPTQQTSGTIGVHDSPLPTSTDMVNHVFSFGARPNPAQHCHAASLLLMPDSQPLQPQQEGQVFIAPEDSNAYKQQMLHPSLTAGLDDWAFQGVDAAFFDSLMRGT
jgi:hypothetical protein